MCEKNHKIKIIENFFDECLLNNAIQIFIEWYFENDRTKDLDENCKKSLKRTIEKWYINKGKRVDDNSANPEFAEFLVAAHFMKNNCTILHTSFWIKANLKDTPHGVDLFIKDNNEINQSKGYFFVEIKSPYIEGKSSKTYNDRIHRNVLNSFEDLDKRFKEINDFFDFNSWKLTNLKNLDDKQIEKIKANMIKEKNGISSIVIVEKNIPNIEKIKYEIIYFIFKISEIEKIIEKMNKDSSNL